MSKGDQNEPEVIYNPSNGRFAHLLKLALHVFVVFVIISTFVLSVALIFFGAIETTQFIVSMTELEVLSHSFHIEALLAVTEIVDLFLLAIVVQVVSLGVYQLYFNEHMHLPKWLRIQSLNDLKSKLVGVIVTMLGVAVLGRVLVWDGGETIAYLGVGAAAVIIALTYFLSTIER